MPPLTGVLVTPTVMLNAALGGLREDGIAVVGPDRVAAVLPMYEEETGASAALASVLKQRHPFDEVVVSVNGGRDATLQVVDATLRAHGYHTCGAAPPPLPGAGAQRWLRPRGGPPVVVLSHPQPTGKAASVNDAVLLGYVSAERILVIDGDTVLAPDFVERLREHFYRLRVERGAEGRRVVIEDVALQSGAVHSRPPRPGRPAAAFISRARTAEYAFAALLRRGQTRRVGRGSVFGASRLYTVVGCGFAARRDAFPVPADTLTEDHDFTLRVQNRPMVERSSDVATLEARGFRVLVDGVATRPSACLDRHDRVVIRRGGEARFVSGASMETEDPPHLGGYVRQVERWAGGGIENALKRGFVPETWGGLRPNVRFAFVAAQAENLIGLLLLMFLPVALGLNAALPGVGVPLVGLGAWVAFDLLITLVLSGLGFVQLERASGRRGAVLIGRVTASLLRSAPAYLVLKYLNPLLYVSAATRAVPAFVRARRGARATTVTWERPAAVVAGGAHARTAGVALVVFLGGFSLFTGVALLASAALPEYREAWELTQRGPRFDAERYLRLPIVPAATAGWGEGLRGRESAAVAGELRRGVPPLEELVALLDASDEASVALGSRYCPRDLLVVPGGGRRLEGDASRYEPMGPWARLMLARIVPLLPYLEDAASVYDVDARLLLQMLINESDLHPLAVGQTNDVGLAQITDDALMLLAAISDDPTSPFANPYLLRGPFNLYDPDFSICAGAAKLAWARAQPGGEDDGVAYARYINPLTGVVRGRVSERHTPLVAAFSALRPLVDAIADTVAAYRLDPASVAAPERALLALADELSEIDLATAYRRTGALVEDLGIDDAALYNTVLEQLYGERLEAGVEPRDAVDDALASR